MVLNNCASTLAKPLTIMFNISFVTGIKSNESKLASVVPEHKKDEKCSVENYRPISLTLVNNLLILGNMVLQMQNHVLHKWFHSHMTLH